MDTLVDYLDTAVVSHNADGRVVNDAASGANVAIERDDDVGADRRSERPTRASELVNIQKRVSPRQSFHEDALVSRLQCVRGSGGRFYSAPRVLVCLNLRMESVRGGVRPGLVTAIMDHG